MRKSAVLKLDNCGALLWNRTLRNGDHGVRLWSIRQGGNWMRSQGWDGCVSRWISQGYCSVMSSFPFQMPRNAILCRKPLGKKGVYLSSQFWALLYHGWQGSHRGWRVEQLITSIAQTREKEWIHAAYSAHFANSYTVYDSNLRNAASFMGWVFPTSMNVIKIICHRRVHKLSDLDTSSCKALSTGESRLC